MKTDKEVRALMLLLDDPDDEVFGTVATRIVNYGKDIIPTLEHYLEVTPDEEVQTRIETLIQSVHFQDLECEFLEWCQSPHPELLRGAVLVAKYQYPDLNLPSLLNQFDTIRRNVWLELNNYLSPLEQVNVFNSIIYNFYKLRGNELTERNPDHFFINHVLESRQGNTFSIGIVYLALCELLDIPIFALDVPRQFILGYIHVLPDIFHSFDVPHNRIQFFIDPMNGMVYSQNDVEVYLNKIKATDKESYFMPQLNKQIIYRLLEELCLCYRYNKKESKANDIAKLMGHIQFSETI